MKFKITSFLYSTRLMAFLFIFFAIAMAAGTFIESAYNTDTARIYVYNAWWFELIMLFFVINFFGNIKRYQLYKKEKWATLLLHLSFILILVGAFVTRYISFEGIMPIKEGTAESTFYSDKTYLTVYVDGQVDGEMKRKSFYKPLLLSAVANNHFSYNNQFNRQKFEIRYKDFIMNGVEELKADQNGKKYLKLVESSTGSRREIWLEEGTIQNIQNVLIAFNQPTEGAINITEDANGQLQLQSVFGGEYMTMATQATGLVVKDELQPLQLRSLYQVAGLQFVFPEPVTKGTKQWVSNNDWKDKETDDILLVDVIYGNEQKTLTLQGAGGKMGIPQSITLGNLDFTILFGSKVYELPFKVKLNDFIAERYPGTINNYKSFESKVTIQDQEKSEEFDARIFMNNILDYRGYRFFQASFFPDETGTVLSVNHDQIGTWLTYLGYFLLYFGLMMILFDKNTRFQSLREKLEQVKAKKATLGLFLFLGLSVAAQHNHASQQAPPLAEIEKFLFDRMASEGHAAKFGALVIQDQGGRMKPVNTFSSELLRKVSKSDHYKDFNSDQVFLSMVQYPRYWMEVPLVYVKKQNDSLRKILKIDSKEKYIPFIKFFDEEGNYKLANYVEEATRATVPNQFQKDFIEVNKRVVLLNTAFSGTILRVFPIPNDENNTWVSYAESAEITQEDVSIIRKIMPLYFMELETAVKKANYQKADEIIEGLNNYQKKFGADVRPTDQKIKSEILYNKYDIFKKLFSWYMIAGVLMLLLAIAHFLTPKKAIHYGIQFFHGLIILFFVLHSFGLATRWYISGHAPWSDAYESMIYVAWATIFFTLAFGRKSKLTVASGTFVASMILMIAHWNWTDPAIANLQPVLDSYWLMIHVAVIVASYGPFALGFILGLVSLVLILLTTEKNKAKMKLNIQEITYVNEMALTIGLIMLTIGNFLGGQWANESWGRYWGWDPKETWALISIMVYAFVIHARFVPFFRGLYAYNVMSVFAFASILMTYFGVNFYLVGLHSYASGDKVITPNFVYITVASVTLLSVVTYRKYKKLNRLK